MISRLRGTLTEVTDNHALVENHGLFYEVMIPSGLAERLKEAGQTGSEITFETIYFIEAGDRKSNEYPRLVGFTDPIDREFFSLLIQVPGMGIKKTLKSLVIPIRDISAAIETKNTSVLTRLPGVGARLAEKIIAELHGKTAKFALSRVEEPLAVAERTALPLVDEAIEVLLQLQYRRAEAVQMVESAIKNNRGIDRVGDLITVIFKNEQKSKAGAL